jgi:acyl-CoA synthetase (NDP forming)
MRELFQPNAVAVVGASRDERKWGGRVVKNLVRYGYRGPILPVNPTADTVQGLACVSEISALPSPIDLAIVAVPARSVEDAIAQLGERGVRVAVVLTSGFAELGESGKSLQSRVAARAREHGLRVCGPNSVGVVNTATGLAAAATSALDGASIPAGGLSLVSQSGAVGLGSLLTRAADRGIGLAKLVSTGNESDLSTPELVEYLAEDSETTAIGVFLEGLADGRALVAAIVNARNSGKAVAVLKVGRSASGAAAAATHTGLLAGEVEVVRGAVDAAGGRWCHDLNDILDQTLLRQRSTKRRRPRVGVMSTSGGINTLAADLLEERGLPVARLSSTTVERIRNHLPDFNPIANPLDISGQVATDMDVQHACLQALASDPGVDAVIVVMTVIRTYSELVERLRAQPPPGSTDVLFVNTGGEIAGDASRALQRLGHPVFESLSAAVGALADATSVRGAASTGATPRQQRLYSAKIRDLQEVGPVPEETLFPLLERYGVRVAPWSLAESARDARRASTALGFPAVVKALARQVRHKSDVGAVVTELRSGRAVEVAFRAISEALRAEGLESRPLLVQRQVARGLEFLVGARTDTQFGPVVTVAYGGVLTEILRRSVTRLAPISTEAAREMVLALPHAAVFAAGYRGQAAADYAALAKTIVGVSAFVAELAANGLSAELDLNPVIVMEDGQGCIAVDALLEITGPLGAPSASKGTSRRGPRRERELVPGSMR